MQPEDREATKKGLPAQKEEEDAWSNVQECDAHMAADTPKHPPDLIAGEAACGESHSSDKFMTTRGVDQLDSD
eukprot:884739-Karenia_brevis.AAC.1